MLILVTQCLNSISRSLYSPHHHHHTCTSSQNTPASWPIPAFWHWPQLDDAKLPHNRFVRLHSDSCRLYCEQSIALWWPHFWCQIRPREDDVQNDRIEGKWQMPIVMAWLRPKIAGNNFYKKIFINPTWRTASTIANMVSELVSTYKNLGPSMWKSCGARNQSKYEGMAAGSG